MTEENYRKWDVLTKIVAPTLTVAVAVFVGMLQFAEKDALEFKRQVWERQLNVYMETANVVGEIPVVAEQAEQADKFQKSVERFYTLYWGNMILLEDMTVREAMIRFHLEINDYIEGISSVERLKVRAANLVETLRKSSHASWKELNAD